MISQHKQQRLPEKDAEHFNLVDRPHTDVLEEKYGPIRAEVLVHNENFRATHLVDSQNISRTFAITMFPKEGHPEALREIDQIIKNGGLIGATFRDHGYSIRKNVLAVEVVELPDWLQTAFSNDSKQAKARYSEFLCRRGDEAVLVYGLVLEIYSPDFRAAEISRADLRQESPTVKSLLAQSVSLNAIWQQIGSGLPCDRTDSRYNLADKNSSREFFFARVNIGHILKNLSK